MTSMTTRERRTLNQRVIESFNRCYPKVATSLEYNDDGYAVITMECTLGKETTTIPKATWEITHPRELINILGSMIIYMSTQKKRNDR